MILVVTRDLIFGTKILDAAKRAKVPATLVDEGIALTAAKHASTIFLDLNDQRLRGLIADLQQAAPQAAIVGWCSHTDTQTMLTAKACGAVALSNGEFARTLPELLEKYR